MLSPYRHRFHVLGIRSVLFLYHIKLKLEIRLELYSNQSDQQMMKMLLFPWKVVRDPRTRDSVVLEIAVIKRSRWSSVYKQVINGPATMGNKKNYYPHPTLIEEEAHVVSKIWGNLSCTLNYHPDRQDAGRCSTRCCRWTPNDSAK